jgi:DNA-binding IclR family transcriptional regulator
MAEKQQGKIKSLKRAERILDILLDHQGANLDELSSYLDLPASTTYDYITTLEGLDLLVKIDGQYRLGTKFLELGHRVRENRDVYKITQPELDILSKQIGEHSSLMIEENGRGVYLYTSEGDNRIEVFVTEGKKTKLHATAPGKAILAHLPDQRKDTIIDRYGLPGFTSNTITDSDALSEGLETIRSQGYAVDREEGIEGLHGIAIPIFSNPDNTLLGAISAYTPSGETIDSFKGEVIAPLRKTANTIEINYRYS